MIRNVVLDWSGTLLDDLSAVLTATNAVLEEYAVPRLTIEQFRAEFALPLAKFYNRFLPGIPLTEIDDSYHKHLASCRDQVSLLPGSREFLEYCAATSRRLFVLSTMQPEHFEVQAARHGVRHFFEKVYVGMNDKRETINSLLKENRLDPAETLLVGDMVHDLEAARRGGVMGVAVLTGFDPIEKLAACEPDAVMRDLITLRRLLETNGNMASEEWIEIVDLEAKSKIGVPEEERVTFQRLLVSLRFQIEFGFEELKDRFESTIDYAAVITETQRIAETNPWQLIETLASEIANALMHRFPMRRLDVELKKFTLPDIRFVSVKTSRIRTQNKRSISLPNSF
jgi:phosphoglycolate phosphatase